MKNLLTVLVLSVSASAFAVAPRDFYPVEFKVTGIQATCPKNAMCFTSGTNVFLTATLNGCVDKVVFTEFKPVKRNGQYFIHATGLAKHNPKSEVTRCYRANTHTEKVFIHENISSVEVINGSIHNY